MLPDLEILFQFAITVLADLAILVDNFESIIYIEWHLQITTQALQRK